MELGDFAREHAITIAEHFARVVYCLFDSVWSLVENQRRLKTGQFRESRPSCGSLRREKSYEGEFSCRQPSSRQRGNDGRRTRDWHNCNRPLDRLAHDSEARIRNERCPSVRHKSDVLSGFEFLYEFNRALTFVVLVIADSGRGDLIMREELAGVASVFASDEVGFFKYAQSAQGYIFEIADRRRNDVQRA